MVSTWFWSILFLVINGGQVIVVTAESMVATNSSETNSPDNQNSFHSLPVDENAETPILAGDAHPPNSKPLRHRGRAGKLSSVRIEEQQNSSCSNPEQDSNVALMALFPSRNLSHQDVNGTNEHNDEQTFETQEDVASPIHLAQVRTMIKSEVEQMALKTQQDVASPADQQLVPHTEGTLLEAEAKPWPIPHNIKRESNANATANRSSSLSNSGGTSQDYDEYVSSEAYLQQVPDANMTMLQAAHNASSDDIALIAHLWKRNA